jgi:hypothetical protein
MDVYCPLNDKEFSLVGHNCNYSSSELGVERKVLKWMISHGLKMVDFHGHEPNIQRLTFKCPRHQNVVFAKLRSSRKP